MDHRRRWWQRIGDRLAGGAFRRDMDDEMRFHIEREMARNVARGMSETEARRAALVSFGGIDRFREAGLDERRTRPVEDLWQDLRHGTRALLRTPLFTAVAVLSLGLGIGANTAIFSVVDGVLLKPLAYGTPERLVQLSWRADEAERSGVLSVADVEAMADVSSLSSYGVWSWDGGGIARTDAGEAESIPGAWVTSGVFATLGVEPLLGRYLLPAEDVPGAARTVVLSEGYWRSRFAGASDVLGSRLMLDGDPYTVVGVMPAHFGLPGVPAAEVWPVLQLEPASYRAPFWLRAVGRLRDDASLAQAEAELARTAASVKERFPDAPSAWKYEVVPLKQALVRDTRATLLLLFGAVGLVMIVAVANVANLLLARMTTRASELAVRTALGAGRGRLIRQLVTESMLIASAGAVVGTLLAFSGVSVLNRIVPANLPRLEEITVDHRTLLFTLAVAVVAGLLVGLLPALRSAGAVAARIREGGRSGAPGRERQRIRSALVIAEFALALTVLIGASLLVNSLIRLQRVDPGARIESVLAVSIALPQARYDDGASVGRFFDELIERIAALPGVRAAAVSMAVPPNRLVMQNPFTPEGREYDPREVPPMAEQLLVSPGYFAALDIPISAGRSFTSADRADAPPVAIINETMARQHFGGRATGRWIQLGDPDPEGTRIEVVGIVPDVVYQGLDAAARPTVYVPFAQNLWWRTMYVVVRTAGDTDAVVPAMRAQLATMDPQIPLREVRTLRQLMGESVAGPRFRTGLLSGFALLALVLATAGIYGVMSYSVAQRAREMSVRLALGARPTQIISIVVSRGILLAAVGAAVGLVAALAGTRLMQSMLFEVSAGDPAIYAASATFMVLVAAAASSVPALRAARSDPGRVLNTE